MPLHIDLLHEIQHQKLARRRDPLKLSILAMLLVGVGFVAFYLARLQQVSSVRTRLGAVQAEWDKLEPKARQAKTEEEELTASIKASETMVKRVDGRFYWAPIFDQVMQAVPREVQITRISGDVSNEAAKPKVLHVVGISSSASEPRKVAEDLRTALDNKLSEKFKHVTSSFRSLEESEEVVTLDGKAIPTANFSMEFQITTAEAAPTPAPVGRKPKS